MKHHLHDEQFDGHLHAACGRTDSIAPSDPRARYFLDDLETVPYADRCRYRACARIWWPHGGEPPTANPAREFTCT